MLFLNNVFVRKKISIKKKFGAKFTVWKFNLIYFPFRMKKIRNYSMWISYLRKEEEQSIQKQWNGKFPNPKHLFSI